MSEEKMVNKAAEPVVEQVRVELATGAMLAVSMIRQTSPECRSPVVIRQSEAALITKALAGLEVGAR